MSRNLRLILMSVGLVAFAAVVWFFLLSPIRGDIKNTESNIADQQSKLLVAKQTLSLAETTRAEGKRNEARLLELAKMIPPTEELPSLLLQIQDLADQAGIKFISITPGEANAVEGEQFETMPLDLTFTGTFFDLSDFIYRAEQMVAGPGRLLAVQSVSLTVSQTPGAGSMTSSVSPTLDVNLSLLAFILPPAGSVPAKGSTAAPATGGATGTTTTTAASSTKKN